MKKRIKRILSVSALAVGLIFLLDASTGITGNAISENIGRTPSYIIGLISAIVGILGLAQRAVGRVDDPLLYRQDIGEVLTFYKGNPTKRNAVKAVKLIEELGYPIQGVDYSEDTAMLQVKGQKNKVPIKFTTKEEGENLAFSLASRALRNDNENEENIYLGAKRKDIRKVVEEFEKSSKKR